MLKGESLMICSSEKVIENKLISEDIYLMKIKGEFQGAPGQFYMIKCWDNELILPRPISIFDIDEEGISFLYQLKGKGTKLISEVNVGERVQIMGPLGNTFNTEVKGKVAIVGGGIGVAPMVYLAKELKAEKVDFYAGFKNVDYSVETVEKYVNKIILSTETGEKGKKGYITELLKPEEYDLVLCCGPEIMMKKVVDMCNKVSTKVFVSMEKRMACGIGACLVCTCKTTEGNKRTCKDGPVFDGKDLIFND
jgi:dihydroorotate dehydrogenase electron transfer subunit